MAALATQHEGSYVIVPVNAGVNEGPFRVVENVPIPEWARPFPNFKWWVPAIGGRPGVQPIWDRTDVRHAAAELQEHLRRLPTRSTLMPLTLGDLIAEEWTPRDDYERERAGAAQMDAITDRPTGALATRHFLCFPTEQSAAAASAEIAGRELDQHMRPSGESWLVLVTHRPTGPDSDFVDESLLRSIAERFGGEHDGIENDVVLGRSSTKS